MTTKARTAKAIQKGSSPKEGLARRQEILSAALNLFSMRDYSAITIKDIAQLAGVNTSLLYYYYDDKEALFRAALEEAVGAAMRNYDGVASKHSEPVDLIKEAGPPDGHLAGRIRVRVVKGVDVPAIGRDFADRLTALAEEAPEAVRVRGAREPAAEADDRDRLHVRGPYGCSWESASQGDGATSARCLARASMLG